MSDPSSSHDDSFADLFAKLPDARQHDAHAADAPAAATPASAADGSSAPLSRRAAREAAARDSHGHDDPAPDRRGPTGQPASEPVASPPPQAPARPTAQPQTAVRSPQLQKPAEAPAPAAAAAASPSAAQSSATLDDLFAAAPPHDTHDRRAKKRRRIGGWIALGVTLLLVGGAVGTGVWVWNTYQDKIREVMGWEEPKDYEPGLAHGEALVTISEGDVPSAISTSLFKAGVTKTGSAFYDMLIKTQQSPTFYPGVYSLKKQMSAAAALEALRDPANKLENSALLVEGLTLDKSIAILSESLDIPLEDFQAAVKKPSDYGVSAKTLEGWLFPAMYTFNPGVTAKEVITTLVGKTVEALDDAGVPEDDRQRILTIASIIQREARFEEDFYKVSRVIQNRLDPDNQETFGYLQMDSTAQYGFGELHDGSASTSDEAQHDDNPWNTYVHTGLPVGPISNPGAQAIDAAMHPADGDWLYFVTVNLDTGETVFTNTLAEHNKAVAQWQQWCKANPDSGC